MVEHLGDPCSGGGYSPGTKVKVTCKPHHKLIRGVSSATCVDTVWDWGPRGPDWNPLPGKCEPSNKTTYSSYFFELYEKKLVIVTVFY